MTQPRLSSGHVSFRRIHDSKVIKEGGDSFIFSFPTPGESNDFISCALCRIAVDYLQRNNIF